MLAHWHPRSALLVLLVLTYASAAEAPADDTNNSSGPPAHRSTVSEIPATFFATGENNRSIATLAKSDFAVVDSALVVRNFRSLARSAETSLDVVALVDLSESAALRLRVAMSDVRQLVAREHSIPDDNIAVLPFGKTPEVSFGGPRPAPLCLNRCRASRSVSKPKTAKSGGATPLIDALIFAANFISHHSRAGAGPVLVPFSDGNDIISVHSPRNALETVLNAGTPIYSIAVGTSDMKTSENPSAGSKFLQQVLEATGGRYFSFSPRFSQQDPSDTVLNALIEDLRASYAPTHDLPSHAAGFHSPRLLPTTTLNPTFLTSNNTDRPLFLQSALRHRRTYNAVALVSYSRVRVVRYLLR